MSQGYLKQLEKLQLLYLSFALVLALQIPEAVGQKPKPKPKPVPTTSAALGTLVLGAVGGFFLLKGELKNEKIWY